MQNEDPINQENDEIEGEPLLVGLTGGIGSGKSTVAQIFEDAGFPVINADKEARYLMEQDHLVKTTLIKRFGEDIYHQDGSLNTALLSSIVFNDKEKQSLADLNSIVHPVLLDHVFEKAGTLAQDHDVIIVDIALLFETHLEDGFDYVIGVLTNPELRLSRLMKDRGMSKEQIQQRMSTQIGDEILKEHADFMIENNGTIEELTEATQYLIEILPYLPNTNVE